MQYFEVSIFVFFKCQSIPVAKSLNKSIAFSQKCKKKHFSELSLRFEGNRQKKANSNFYHGIASCLTDGGLWTAIDL